MPEESHGTARERQVRDVAARLGVADFVYTSPRIRRGSAQREASGDGLLLVGERGAILQVKARDPSTGQRDSSDRARSWVQKHVRKATKQLCETLESAINLDEICSAFPVISSKLSVG